MQLSQQISNAQKEFRLNRKYNYLIKHCLFYLVKAHSLSVLFLPTCDVLWGQFPIIAAASHLITIVDNTLTLESTKTTHCQYFAVSAT